MNNSPLSSATEEKWPADFEFRPLPFLRNPHVQTVLGVLVPGADCPLPDQRYIVRLPDGDALVLHNNTPLGWKPGDALALLVHGLSGSHASAHIRRMTAMLLAQRVRVVRMDLRGAGAGLSLARRVYHAGRSDDIRAALEEVHSWSPASPLLLLGISLGGALVLKMAGEAADRPIAGLTRIAAAAPPIDLPSCAVLLALPKNRIYEDNFLRDLTTAARLRRRYFPDLPPLRFPRRMTMRLFDELYTAPRSGFDDAQDYYQKASCAALIPRIQVPTLILTSRDDPFVAVEPFEQLKVPPHILVRIVSHGGHIGFLGWDGAGGIRWAERRMVEWILQT
ncbi:MAG TPA: alpha/beta fold hydrolase [Gemmataceae bacterium]|nr:alpha/beta fold hydrolase [Gemmataceae bacterium]